MRIILFRHGIAEERDAARWPDDSKRPLTGRGERRARRAAQGLACIERSVERLVTSPFVRAERTARILSRVLEIEAEVTDALVPGGATRRIMDTLNGSPVEGSVVLVGHEPDLGALAGFLLFGNLEAALPLKKAGACAIEIELPVRPGGGTLMWAAPPHVLFRISRKKVPA